MSDFKDPKERPATARRAEDLIDEIRFDIGIVDQDDENELSKTSAGWASKVRRGFEKHRNITAKFTKTVANQLYTTKFRFIYELIQNADDAEYHSDCVPTLIFRLQENKVVIESNENGFTVANVQAICSTGDSSKVNEQESTGEKGFGFKSVFGIADEVNVQSGKFSFMFKHRRGEDGLGMVTPIWTTSADDLTEGIGTRFRLALIKTGQADLEALLAEFLKLPPTVVFALRRIKKLMIQVDGFLGQSFTMAFEKYHIAKDELIITVEDSRSANLPKEMLNFKTIVSMVYEMPETEERPNQSTSEVTLAFPVDRDGRPLLHPRGQHVFAFLPVQRFCGLPFLIQADFILSANREAVPDNDWNSALRMGTVHAFVKAVEGFSGSGSHLKYQWMRYLPSSELEGFWDPLFRLLKRQLASSLIFESRQGRHRSIKHLRALPDIFLVDEEPLVPDLPGRDVYLSDKYAEDDIRLLRRLHLTNLSSNEMLARICEDSTQLDGRLRSIPLTDRWHDFFIALVNHLMEDSSNLIAVYELKFIPLSDGSWVAPSELRIKPVYTPYAINANDGTIRVPIPQNICVPTLHSDAYQESDRARFYANRGISDCPSRIIIHMIKEKQKLRTGDSFTNYLRHLEIFFWFDQPNLSLWPNSNASIQAVDQNYVIRDPEDLFLPTTQEFDAADLLSRTTLDKNSTYGMLHQSYLDSSVKSSMPHGRTWEQWLKNKAGIRCYPSLVKTRNGRHLLNPVLQTVAKDNPIKFVANLQAHWQSSYAAEPWNSVRDEIASTILPCTDGQSHPLAGSVLPCDLTLAEARSFGLSNRLPFLVLPAEAVAGGTESWQFLKSFDVLCDVDLNFYLLMLSLIRQDSTGVNLDTVCIQIYEKIAKTANLDDRKRLQELFHKQQLTLNPRANGSWLTPSDIRWNGPSILCQRVPLATYYGKKERLHHLFVNLLGTADATVEDVLFELRCFKEKENAQDNSNFNQQLLEFYGTLDSMSRQQSDIESLRTQFNEYKLIYVRGHWCAPESGIWSCTVELAGRYPVEDIYPNLKNFFVDKLEVMIANTGILLRELKRAALSNPPQIGRIKNIMLATAQLISRDADQQDARYPEIRDLRQAKFLPVRCGDETSLERLNGTFFVIDHERYGKVFAAKLKLLDFEYSDLSILLPLLDALKIAQERYLSRAVMPETIVGTSSRQDKLTTHLRSRAYALSCCAISHKSPAFQQRNSDLHNMLLNAEVAESSDMWTNLVVRSGDEEVEAKSERALIQIAPSEGVLRVVAPVEEELLLSCYQTELPAFLARFLQVENGQAEKQIYRILLDDRLELDEIMSFEDITPVLWLEKSPEAEISIIARPTVVEGDGIAERGAATSLNTLNGFLTPNDSTTAQIVQAEQNNDHLVAPPVPTGLSIIYQVSRDNRYKKLLDHVIRQARNAPGTSYDSERNVRDPFSMTGMRQALQDFSNFNEIASNPLNFYETGGTYFEENVRVGAAGELFVFERLRALGASNLDEFKHWASSIRSTVNVHPDYQNLNHPGRIETADFEYSESDKLLGNILLEHCHNGDLLRRLLSAETSQREVSYLIEVKSTTGSCEIPFFMSGKQYQTMEDNSLGRDEQRHCVYVLIRVYDLLSNNIGMEIFVDPWRLRGSLLNFTTNKWDVTTNLPRN